MYIEKMRTTVEMKPEHRSALLALASRRGQKGFSVVLGEAIESFLQGEADREKRRQTLRSLGGGLSDKDAADLRRAVKELRESWR
jgi:predicted DNA-binding protein